MKREHYWVEVVTFSVVALLAAARVLVSLTAPKGDQGTTISGVVWLIVSSLVVVEAIRRKELSSTRLEVKPSLMFILSLLFLFICFLEFMLADTLGLAQILNGLTYLVLGLFLFFGAIVTADTPVRHSK